MPGLRVCMVIMTQTNISKPGTQKMRRDVVGGKRGNGHFFQKIGRKVRRPNPGRVRNGISDQTLTSAAGLVPFGTFIRNQGVDAELSAFFGGMKTGRSVVYTMPSQIRLLIDAGAAGESRVFGLEHLSSDPLFVHLSGGTVPSIDTVYRDLDRFDGPHLLALEHLMARHGMWKRRLRNSAAPIHLDIDTTVEPLFGSQEGARVGYNPRYHGRPSYHPIIARVAETRTCVGALLRPGDSSFGDDDASFVRHVTRRVHDVLGHGQALRVRIDKSGDCAAIMNALQDEHAVFVTKARLTPDLASAVFAHKNWRTVLLDEENKPLRQVAELSFARDEWNKNALSVRVIALRTREPVSGGEAFLWPGLEYSAKVFLTNDFDSAADAIAREYEDRAGIEPMIDELKRELGIGAVPTDSFDANQAMLLIKLLAYNLVRRFVDAQFPHLSAWRLSWLRRALFCVPGRFLRSGHRYYLRLPPGCALNPLLN